MVPLFERIKRGELLVCDGAMGTMLQAQGLQPGECPELWNVTRPEAVQTVCAAYVQAGSDIISTNTFGGNPFKLREYGLAERVTELNAAGIRVARAAAGDAVYVMASVGSTGQILEDEGGEAQEGELYDAFAAQIRAQAEAGADAILVETMLSTLEAAQAVRAAKAVCALPVLASFTFAKGARGFRTVMGASPARVAEEMVEAGADVVGANCGGGITDLLEVAREFHTAMPGVPLLIQANAGIPTLEGGRTIFTESPEAMAAQVPALIDAGVTLIGGCCGTTPAHIAAMAGVVKG